MDIEWGVSKRSKASKRGRRIDRIVSSKLALLDGAESREKEFSKLFENFRPRIRHRNQISTDRSRGRERERASLALTSADTFANAGENFPVNESTEEFSRKSTESSPWKRISQHRVRFFSTGNLEDLSKRNWNGRRLAEVKTILLEFRAQSESKNILLNARIGFNDLCQARC